MMKVRLRDKSGIRVYRYLVEDVDRHGNVLFILDARGDERSVLPKPPARTRLTRNISDPRRNEGSASPRQRRSDAGDNGLAVPAILRFGRVPIARGEHPESPGWNP